MTTPPIECGRLRLARPANPGDWEGLVTGIEPSLYAFYRRHGLQDADARDLIQTTLVKLLRVAEVGSFDPALGSFEAYLFRIAQNNLRDFFRGHGKPVRGVGGSEDRFKLEEVPDCHEDEVARREAEEHRAARVRKVHAAAHAVRPLVRPSQWQAFWMTCVRSEAVAVVARRLRMKELTVYRSKYKIAPLIRKLVEEWECE